MKNKIIYFLPLLALIPIFIFRDYTPDNELRYISIIEEAIRNGSIFTFYNQGVAYADKPPLYFWLLMICRELTGQNIMLLMGLFTLIPCAVIFYIMHKFSKINSTPMLMLITSVMFVGSTVVLRMDMLMVMFITLALYNFYRLYSGTGSRADSYLLPINIFLALFSKGPVGVLVPIVSIAVFLLTEHKLKTFGRYLGWKQWAIILGLCAIWFTGVYLEGGYDYIHNLLFKQTVGRSINSFHHKEPIYYYLKTIWYAIAPWSIFCIVTITKGFTQKIIQKNTLYKFFSVIIISTFVMMSLVSSKIDIYLLPIYPFMIYLSVMLLRELHHDWLIKGSLLIPSVILILSPIAMFFVKELPFTVVILSLSGIWGVVYILKNNLEKACRGIAIGILSTIFILSFSIPKFNSTIGFRVMAERAKEVAQREKIATYAFYQFRSGENMDVYLGQALDAINTIDELKELNNTILFVRNREIRRQDDFRDYLKNLEFIEEIGDYKIYIIR